MIIFSCFVINYVMIIICKFILRFRELRKIDIHTQFVLWQQSRACSVHQPKDITLAQKVFFILINSGWSSKLQLTMTRMQVIVWRLSQPDFVAWVMEHASVIRLSASVA